MIIKKKMIEEGKNVKTIPKFKFKLLEGLQTNTNCNVPAVSVTPFRTF